MKELIDVLEAKKQYADALKRLEKGYSKPITPEKCQEVERLIDEIEDITAPFSILTKIKKDAIMLPIASVVNRMHFLTEEQKMQLTKYLMCFKKEDVIHHIKGFTGVLSESILKTLVEEGILKEVRAFYCQSCKISLVSKYLTEEGQQILEELLMKESSDLLTEEDRILLNRLVHECEEDDCHWTDLYKSLRHELSLENPTCKKAHIFMSELKEFTNYSN